MKSTFKSGLAVGMLVAALALTGCGDNDNNENGNDNDGGPQRTATPAPQRTSTPAGPTATGAPVATATPTGGTEQTVTFALTTTGSFQGFKVEVTYPSAKGSFSGTADNTGCTKATGPGIFIPNDDDNGKLLLVGAEAVGAITFPVTITCTFDATTAITTDDLGVTVTEVTNSSNGQPGDPATLTVATTVAP